MNVQFIASVSIISAESGTTRGLLTRVFGLPLEPASADPDYVFSERIEGSKHFGVWPLAQAAAACFGSASWPKDLPVPQVSVEFEVARRSAGFSARKAQSSASPSRPGCTTTRSDRGRLARASAVATALWRPAATMDYHHACSGWNAERCAR